jgi:hypothetical protein
MGLTRFDGQQVARLPADRHALGPAPAARPARSVASAMNTAGQRTPSGARFEQVEKFEQQPSGVDVARGSLGGVPDEMPGVAGSQEGHDNNKPRSNA